MVITIYKTDASPPARAVLMIVDILGLKIETKEVSTVKLEQYRPEFLEKNPIHTIPLLEDGDFILADSHAIMTYLVSKYGADKRSTYYPVDLRTRATIDQRLFFDATLLFPHIRNIVINILKNKTPGPDPKQIAEVQESYGFLEKYLERSPFLAAEHVTLADISCVATVSSLDDLVPVDGEKYPNVVKWWGTLKNQDWYQKMNEPGLAEFSSILKQAMANNSGSN